MKLDDSIIAIPIQEYLSDLLFLMDVISHGPCKTFAYNRLKIIEARFRLHLLLNEHIEIAAQKVT